MSDPMPFKPNTRGRTRNNFPAGLPSRRFIAAVVALGGMQLMVTMDGSIAAVALPKIQNELNLTDAGRSWVLTAYMLAFGGLLLVGGRLGDTIGLKRIFIVGVALFTTASAVCGIAQDGGTRIAARLLQGLAGAIIAPTSVALVATTFPKGPGRSDWLISKWRWCDEKVGDCSVGECSVASRWLYPERGGGPDHTIARPGHDECAKRYGGGRSVLQQGLRGQNRHC
jgi:hypothetical protein